MGFTLRKTFDHILPKAQGGTNDKNNLVPCCHMCNTLKSNRGINQFIEYLKSYKDYGLFFTKERIGIMIANAYKLTTPPPYKHN